MTVSSEVIAGRQEVLCAHVEHLSEPVNLTVALEVDSASTVLLEEPVAQPFYRCLRFQVGMQTYLYVQLCFSFLW